MTSTADHPRPAGRDLVMVRFGLVVDEDGRAPREGWPAPVESEGLWASVVGEGRYRIENTPWFARDLSRYDVVDAVSSEGVRWVMRRAEWSGHLTVRVTPSTALDAFADLGVSGESAAPAWPIAALDIPPDVDLRSIVDRLRAGRADGIWDYDEACVSTRWREL